MLGIIGAMPEEIDGLLKETKNLETITIHSLNFYKGKLNNTDVIIAMSGVGKVNMAIYAQCMIDNFSPQMLINTGIAGGLDKSLNVGDIVISTDALEHDMNLTGLGYKKGEIPDMETSVFTADKKFLDKVYSTAKSLFKDTGINVIKGRVCSGDLFVSKKSQKENLASIFNASCAEMEGASLAHCAYINKIPFVIVRVISDSANGDSTIDYREFKIMASNRSVALIKEICKNI